MRKLQVARKLRKESEITARPILALAHKLLPRMESLLHIA